MVGHFFLFFLLWYWGLNSGHSPWATPRALFLWRVFQDRVLRTICPGWIWTASLLISAPWVAGTIGMSHWHPAGRPFLSNGLLLDPETAQLVAHVTQLAKFQQNLSKIWQGIPREQMNGLPLFCLGDLVLIKSLDFGWNLNTLPLFSHLIHSTGCVGGRTRLLDSPFKDKALELSREGHPIVIGSAGTEPTSSRHHFLLWTYWETQGTLQKAALFLQISDRFFWAFVVFGMVIIIIFGMGLYSVAPSEWTISEKLLCFSFYSISTLFWGLLYFWTFNKLLFKKSVTNSAK
jgi:hypothetical protein